MRTGDNRTPVILDTDIGADIDDTWALAMLLNCPELDVKLVVGDTGDTTYRAKLIAKFLDIAGRGDVPVGIGPACGNLTCRPQEPWVKDYDLTDYSGTVHEDGVGAIIDTIMSSPDEITLICIGPVPNIGEALRREPRIVANARFIGMHGSVYAGRCGFAEPTQDMNTANFTSDCQAVFTADWDVTIAPMDSASCVNLTGAKYQAVRDCQTPMVQALMENYATWLENHDTPWGRRWTGCLDVKSSTLYDTVPIYLAFTDELLMMWDLGIRLTDEARTVVDEDAKLMHVALGWKGLAEFEALLVDRLTADIEDERQ